MEENKSMADFAEELEASYGRMYVWDRLEAMMDEQESAIVEITEVVPEPLLSTYQNNLIHQISKNNLSPEKNVFSQTFVLTVYETNTVVNQPKKIVDFSDMNKNFRKDFLTSNKIIVSDSKEIQTLANKIVQKVKMVRIFTNAQ